MGSELRVGDLFTVATSLQGDARSVHLRIESIDFYGKPVSSVDQMMSCELVVAGLGLDAVSAGTTLSGSILGGGEGEI